MLLTSAILIVLPACSAFVLHNLELLKACTSHDAGVLL